MCKRSSQWSSDAKFIFANTDFGDFSVYGGPIGDESYAAFAAASRMVREMETMRMATTASSSTRADGNSAELDYGSNSISKAYQAFARLTDERLQHPRRIIDSPHADTIALLEARPCQLWSYADRWRMENYSENRKRQRCSAKS